MTEKRRSNSRKFDLPGEFRAPFRDIFHAVAPVAKRLGLRAFLVGGVVRDLMEGRRFAGDWDVVVFGGDGKGAALLAGEVAAQWGRSGAITFPRFGTHLVPGPGVQVEVAQADSRTTLKGLDGDALTADALSRDFTLNALYIRLEGAEAARSVRVIDPCGRGVRDLENALLRTPVRPALTLADDPLRIFRAARLRATRSYRISPDLGRSARSLCVLTGGVAVERIREELHRILLSERPSRGLEVLGRWGAFAHTMPEIQAMVGFRQESPYHFPDLFRHSLRVVDNCRADLALRWAALLHDCGKPLTKVPSPVGDTYYGHDSVGAGLAGGLLARLRTGRGLAREVAELVGLHMVHYQEEWSDQAVRRFIRRAGPHLEKLLALAAADSAALRLRAGKLTELEELARRIEDLRGRTPPPGSPLDGKRIMKILDVSPGRDVGWAKRALSEAVGEGQIPPEEKAAEEYLVRWWKERGGRSS